MSPAKVNGWVGWISPLFHILPMIDQANVYDAIDQTQMRVRTNDYPNNLFLKTVAIPGYRCPSDPSVGTAPANNYRMSWGPITGGGRDGDDAGTAINPWTATLAAEIDGTQGGAWADNGSLSVSSFGDGSSNTILYSERITGNYDDGSPYSGNFLHQVGGAKVVDKGAFATNTTASVVAACAAASATVDGAPAGAYSWRTDFGADRGDEIPFLYSSFAAGAFNSVTAPNSPIYDCGCGSVPDSTQESAVVAARSAHTGTVLCCLADGSVRTVGASIDLGTYQAATTRNGGELIGAW
jgi:hypothetical protein